MTRVLLIEPDRKLARTYLLALEAWGHTVDWAGHAQDAVLAADANLPDIILVELQLTAHSGYEFLYEFRSYAEWQAVPVVLLTYVAPHAANITAAHMERFGIVQCLYKPAVTLVQLRRAVEQALRVSV